MVVAVVRTVEELLWWQRLWKKKNKRREKNRQDEGSVFGDRKHLSASGSTWLKYIVLVQWAKKIETAQHNVDWKRQWDDKSTAILILGSILPMWLNRGSWLAKFQICLLFNICTSNTSNMIFNIYIVQQKLWSVHWHNLSTYQMINITWRNV